MKLLRAHSVLLAPGEWIPGGAVLFDERIRAVARSPEEVRRLEREAGVTVEDVGGGLLSPGLVDAHAHLELTGLDPGEERTFRGWLAGLMATRSKGSPEQRAAAAREGADRLLRTGTTRVGDIDSTGSAHGALLSHPIRVCLYREVIDAWLPERTPKALKHVRSALRVRPGMTEGVSPHAPYTVSAELFAGLRDTARARGLPVTIHWSETPEEVEWLLHGTGALAGLIERHPGQSGLDLIEGAGLLERGTSLVHGNHPGPGELERIARAGASVVHCPGSHAYFGRAPFPMGDYLAAGVRVALGTDSEASNDELDMGREMSLLRSAHPDLAPDLVWSMATVHGARALGAREQPGTLREGAAADLCLFDVRARDEREALETLTAARPRVLGTWIAGCAVSGVPDGGVPG